MSWVDRTLAGLFPSYQLRRLEAKRITNAYESAQPSRLHKAKKEGRGPNLPVGEATKPIREQVRYLEQNTDIVNGALDVLVANIVGPGVKPEPQVKNRAGELLEDVNLQLSELWDDWAKRPEVTWQHDERSAQRMLARSWLRDGEVLYQHVLGARERFDHGTEVPYSYEMIECDLLPVGYTDESKLIVQGVELNAWRRPVAYHVYKTIPDDSLSVAMLAQHTKRMPADRVEHIKHVKRINQVRGVSVFASVLRRLADVEEIDESERVAARIAASLGFYVKKGEPMMYVAPAENDDGYREMDFQPGMFFDDLEPGEELGTFGSNRPNNEIIPFRDAQIRSMASGIGVSFSSLSKNYNGTYSAQRQELVEQALIYRMLWSYFISRSEMPKWERFVLAAQASGGITLPRDTDLRSVCCAAYSPVAMPWIDPLKEAKAWIDLNAAGFESKEHINRQRGRDPREVERQLQREGQTNAQPQSAAARSHR